MPLSAHERTQFERLTADLALDDSALKKMVKRDNATAMSYVPLPRFSTVLRVMMIMATLIGFVGALEDNLILLVAGTVCAALLLLGSSVVLDNEMSAARHKKESVE
jgi:hypothetical protein